MAATLPPPGSFTPLSGTTASRAQLLNDLVEFLFASLGGKRDQLYNVSGGTIAPTQALIRVDTSGSASSANLDTITVAGLPEAGHLIMRCQDATRVITVRSGMGNVTLAGSQSMVLDHPSSLLWLTRTSTGMAELFRWYGRSQARAREWLGLTDPASKAFATLTQHAAGAATDLVVHPAGLAWALGDDELMIGDRDELGSYQAAAELLVRVGSALYRAPLSLLLSKSFAADFTTGELAISNAGGSSSIAHGLGGVPRAWRVLLRCKTAELGYALGDEVPYGGAGLQVRADTTNLAYRFAATAQPISLLDAATGALTAITNANWRAVVRVWR